jgi:hypothetical protein
MFDFGNHYVFHFLSVLVKIDEIFDMKKNYVYMFCSIIFLFYLIVYMILQ